MKELSEDAKRLLDMPNFAHLCTLLPDGSPKSEPVWVLREGDWLLVTTDAKSIKAKNVAADARVSISVVNYDNPYDQVLIRGRVTEMRDDDDLAVMDAMAQKYLGTDFPRRAWSKRVVFVIEADVARAYKSPLVDPRTP
ncbi:TIGR03618 family F420-dependent PPOX class oxidoreductase [Rhodococcus globerulus]|uniref:TIGR03618 family F420-dependent PPOX class oxidoreductase n=1 Tax=Rhodococcus globerulus TaxID=33008 RepID=UPI00301759E0